MCLVCFYVARVNCKISFMQSCARHPRYFRNNLVLFLMMTRSESELTGYMFVADMMWSMPDGLKTSMQTDWHWFRNGFWHCHMFCPYKTF